jgi:hypothetical protein
MGFSCTFFMIIWLLHLDTCCQTEQKIVCIVTLVIIYIQNFLIYYINTMDTSFILHPSISIWWLEILGILFVDKWPVFYIYSHFNLPIFVSLSVSSCNKNNTCLNCTTAGNHLFCGSTHYKYKTIRWSIKSIYHELTLGQKSHVQCFTT